MGDRLAEMFERTRAEGRTAVIPFIPCGWPAPEDTVPVVQAAIEGGADAFELGLPFSDPLGDGPVNQAAYDEAIANGVNTASVFETVRALRSSGVRAPLLIMGYFNPLLAYGVSSFVQDAVAAGVDGLIIVDLPPDEAAELEEPARAAGLHLVYLLAPNSTPERIRLVAEHAGGFIYCVSLTGVTGERRQLPEELPEFLRRVRAQTSVPLAVGFGISAAEHVRDVGKIADAAIIGSAFVRTVSEASAEQRPAAARAFLEEMTGRAS